MNWFSTPAPIPGEEEMFVENDLGQFEAATPAQLAKSLLEKTTGWENDEHGAETPQRFAAMLEELTTPEPIKWKTFDADGYDEMIVVKDIPFVSVCNHHVVPFVGLAYVGYIPDKQMAGLSKFARVVRHFAKRLQVQERLTNQVATYLMEHLDPLGVAVVMEAEHMCMTIRGVQTPGTMTVTSAMKGVFADHDRTAKNEFLRLIGK